MREASALGVLAAVAAGLLVVGCDGGASSDDVVSGPGSSAGKGASAPQAPATTKTRCDVGELPDYFVPGGDDGPFAIIGCARLGVSEKPVEFSADYERIGPDDHVCLDPAYRGRGQLGIYIPAVCVRDPVSTRLEVVSVEIPRQAVRGYELVIFGTAESSTRRVIARYAGGTTAAAVFPLRRPLASAVGATAPFSVYVVELHSEAACRPILLRSRGLAGPMNTRIEARPRLCQST